MPVVDPIFAATLGTSPVCKIQKLTDSGEVDGGGQVKASWVDSETSLSYRLEPLAMLGASREVVVDKRVVIVTDLIYFPGTLTLEPTDIAPGKYRVVIGADPVDENNDVYLIVALKNAPWESASGVVGTHHKEAFLKRTGA